MIRLPKEHDHEELYKLSIELLRNHEDPSADTWITYKDFRCLIRERFAKFYVLIMEEHDGRYDLEQRPSKRQGITEGEKVAGYVAFLDDYDLQFGGPGILVDQFFVSTEFRGKGNGKYLLNEVYKQALNRGAKYIKLFFQQREDRNNIYKRLGYKNCSDYPPFLRLYEIYGSQKLKEHLGLDVFEDLKKANRKSTPPETRISQYEEEGYSYFIKNNKLVPDLDCRENNPFPDPCLVIVVKYSAEMYSRSAETINDHLHMLFGPIWENNIGGPWVIWEEVSGISREHDPTIQICGFVERPSICCWLGHKLVFSNFVGDLSLITKDLLVRRIRSWSPQWGPILGVDLEIAGDGNREPTSANNVLIRTLNSLGVSCDDSWKCVILDENQIHANFVNEE